MNEEARGFGNDFVIGGKVSKEKLFGLVKRIVALYNFSFYFLPPKSYFQILKMFIIMKVGLLM